MFNGRRARERYDKSSKFEKVTMLCSMISAWDDFLAHPGGEAHRLNERRVRGDLVAAVQELHVQHASFMRNEYGEMKARGDMEVQDCITEGVHQELRNIKVHEDTCRSNVESTRNAMRYHKNRPEKLARDEQYILEDEHKRDIAVALCKERIAALRAGDIATFVGADITIRTLERVMAEADAVLERHPAEEPELPKEPEIPKESPQAQEDSAEPGPTEEEIKHARLVAAYKKAKGSAGQEASAEPTPVAPVQAPTSSPDPSDAPQDRESETATDEINRRDSPERRGGAPSLLANGSVSRDSRERPAQQSQAEIQREIQRDIDEDRRDRNRNAGPRLYPDSRSPDEPAQWHAQWSKAHRDQYRELQNIPNHWGARKVVLIWFGEKFQGLRVFGDHDALADSMMEELFGLGSQVKATSEEGGRFDFSLTREQYDHASAGS